MRDVSIQEVFDRHGGNVVGFECIDGNGGALSVSRTVELPVKGVLVVSVKVRPVETGFGTADTVRVLFGVKSCWAKPLRAVLEGVSPLLAKASGQVSVPLTDIRVQMVTKAMREAYYIRRGQGDRVKW